MQDYFRMLITPSPPRLISEKNLLPTFTPLNPPNSKHFPLNTPKTVENSPLVCHIHHNHPSNKNRLK